jgi:hypothetical protein
VIRRSGYGSKRTYGWSSLTKSDSYDMGFFMRKETVLGLLVGSQKVTHGSGSMVCRRWEIQNCQKEAEFFRDSQI